MKPTFRTARLLLLTGTMMFALIPGAALAHDNIGGDELSMSGAMLVGAIAVTVMALVAGIWAWRAGQFSNVEDSKFSMLDTADNYDVVMAEAERVEAQERAAELSTRKGHKPPTADGKPLPATVARTDHKPHLS